MENNPSNPNGANGTTSDPREQKMWDIYVGKLSKGIENAKESALEAGYEESTASQITVRSWFIERKSRLKRKDMLSKSEKVLDETLDMITVNEEGKTDPQLHKIKVDVAKTIVTTLGKDEGYSSRTEQTGKDGAPLQVIIPKEVAEAFNIHATNEETIRSNTE
jgi:hypothetical protein